MTSSSWQFTGDSIRGDGNRERDRVPVRFGPGITPPTRAWDYTIKLRDGDAVHVSGAAVPGGRIDVKYTPDGTEQVAANAADYIYPADVRLDSGGELWFCSAPRRRSAG